MSEEKIVSGKQCMKQAAVSNDFGKRFMDQASSFLFPDPLDITKINLTYKHNHFVVILYFWNHFVVILHPGTHFVVILHPGTHFPFKRKKNFSSS